jgi:hypothetical protein
MRVPPPPHQGDDSEHHQGGDKHQEDDAENWMMGMMAIAEHGNSSTKHSQRVMSMKPHPAVDLLSVS